MPAPLNERERRVLGVLLEKSMAQPQYYPMTCNAIVAACNQKSNRDPQMDLDEEAVWDTLEVMRAGGLVARLLPGGSSRVERFKHEALEFYGWEKPQRAVMAELLLRGPQTVGELRTRCMRMYAFENGDAVQAVLETLMQGAEPMVVTLPRAPGQSAVRHAHRLYSADDRDAPSLSVDVSAEVSSGVSEGSRPAPVVTAGSEIDTMRDQIADLIARVEALEARVADRSS